MSMLKQVRYISDGLVVYRMFTTLIKGGFLMNLSEARPHAIVSEFRMDHMMRYSLFVPRLYNLCRSLGFDMANIMPSRAFCADENQGFPIILITKHFGAFPFNHGRAGGIVATNRHGPHAHHGNDMVIIQASHVGYDPETETFGTYCRLQTPDGKKTSTCGKIAGVIDWYLEEYEFAQKNIYLSREGDLHTLIIDNQLLDEQRTEGLFLELDRMVLEVEGKRRLLRTLSTSRVYVASETFCKSLPEHVWPENGRIPIGCHLDADMFFFKRHNSEDEEGSHQLEDNLLDAMPCIVTSTAPMLVAAQINTQAEFDHTFRSIVKADDYRGKRLLFVSCLNIDISPKEGQLFPLTKCVPWAAYIQNANGESSTLEQVEIYDLLMKQSMENSAQIDMEVAIQQMVDAPEVKVRFSFF